MRNYYPYEIETPDGYEEYQEDIIVKISAWSDAYFSDSEHHGYHVEPEEVETIFSSWRRRKNIDDFLF